MILKFLLSTGARVSEISKLKIKDLNFQKTKGWFRKTKGGETRVFKLDRVFHLELIDFINKYG